jgi:hypothetical protein
MPNTFIVLTDLRWINYLRSQNMNEAIYPKGGGDTTRFEVGDCFYFATRRLDGNPNNIAGRGVVTRVENDINTRVAWNTYQTKLGFTEHEYVNFSNGRDIFKLIHLDHLQWLQPDSQFPLTNEIFNSNWRGGNGHLRRLTNDVNSEIIEQVHEMFRNALSEQEVYINDQVDEELEITNNEYQEGANRLTTHRTFERNRTIITQVKNDLPWTCDICEMRFDDRYDVDYIEAHHKIPLSQAGVRMTGVGDIALLCANCHRAVHKKMAIDLNRTYESISEEITTRLRDNGEL